jgi:small subunit ribosomal protein S9
MADEPRDQQQDDEQPQDEAQAEGEQPQAESQEAEEQSGEDSQPAEGGDDAPEAGDESAEGEEGANAEAPSEQPKAEKEEGKSKGTELPPGADLDPIALEPERELSAEERARLEAEAEEKARLEAEVTADAPEEQPAAAPREPAQLAAEARYLATGKRKRSIARVIVTPGDGKFVINDRPLAEYFPRPLHQSTALQPLSVSGYEGTVDVSVNVQGGGIGGQAGAVRHGIARALTEIDPQLRKELKRRGFLTRDARVKERRKAGLKKARKRPQFSKR